MTDCGEWSIPGAFRELVFGSGLVRFDSAEKERERMLCGMNYREVLKAFAPEKEPSPISLTSKHGYSKLFRTVPYVPCDPWAPLSLELRDIDMPAAALGLVVISTPDCAIAAKRIQPRDGDGPGWALLEEVRSNA